HPCGQVANFVIECALADLWRSWGIKPDVVLGHSLGDFAAAYTAGVLTLEDGVRLVAERGRLMETADGEMVSVLASEAEVAPLVAAYEDVTIGVINGPQSVVISGGRTHVLAIAEQLQADGYKTRKLAIPMAAHSPLLDPVLDDFERAVRKITLAPPKLRVISSMTGQPVTNELTDPTYWRNHLRQTVRFADGIATLQAQGVDICIEIGPKPTLLGMAKDSFDKMTGPHQVIESSSHPVILSSCHPLLLPSLRKGRNSLQQMVESLGKLYVHGAAIEWRSFHRERNERSSDGTERRQRKVVLPTYPFQQQRYWATTPKRQARASLNGPAGALIDKQIRSPLHNATLFETAWSLEAFPYLRDHQVYGAVVSPGAAHLALAVSAAASTWGQLSCTVADVIFPAPLVIPEESTAPDGRTVQLVLTPLAANGHGPAAEFKLLSF
ncbi:MAG: acyltransferase domain-containing protein, partial [Caldilineaceae bacterium]|nr:acyltransferase domain-containing protein [Caldilineaceae bacterium]